MFSFCVQFVSSGHKNHYGVKVYGLCPAGTGGYYVCVSEFLLFLCTLR
jgi:hypothetical protein